MRALIYLIYITVTAFTLTGIVGCTGSSSDRLRKASDIVNEKPDSAYAILRDIDYFDLDEDSLKSRYILTRAITNVRVGRSLITDTLLNDAANYYISTGDTINWIIASQLLAGYDFTRDDSESALRRLEDMMSRIRNSELLWDTYIHLLEVAIKSENYEKAYIFADWLLRHTNVPAQILKFGTAKGVALYMRGDSSGALAILDSIIAVGVTEKVPANISDDFYYDYAEILDGAGQSSKALSIIDSLGRNGGQVTDDEKIGRLFASAQFYANLGNSAKARMLLDSINHDGTKSVFEVYASVAMLKSALQYKETGHFPAELMHRVTKNIQRNHEFAQFDRQTAMESVIELNDDNYELKLQRQRLWLFLSIMTIILIVAGVTVYFILTRHKQRLVEAEERAETLKRMLKDAESAEKDESCLSDRDKLKAALLRQLGIFKTFAGIPTQQSRDALKKISNIGNENPSLESLVDWQNFYSMVDNLYDDFHTKLINNYPGIFNDKEQQIIVLLKAGFSTKEIGVLTEQSSATIYTRKSVIRKKLGSPENGDFIALLDERNKGC